MSKIKDYMMLSFVFLLFYVSFDTASRGAAPPTFGYLLCATVLVFGILACRRHTLKPVLSMFTSSIIVQLIFMMVIPYWVLKVGYGINTAWPLYPELLWTTGSLIFWYYGLSFVIIPVIVFLFGRRAWCSFACSIGAIAETLGDRYRTCGKKGNGVPAGYTAIKSVILIMSVAITVAALAGRSSEKLFYIVFLIFFIILLRTFLMNAVNLILMPKLGTRIWCKYFCPQGLLLGFISRIGRFALVKDTSSCVGCGTCNAYCHMSIDIAGGPVVNRSGDCVGCGVCVEVCPQKVLTMTTDPAIITSVAAHIETKQQETQKQLKEGSPV